MDYTHKGNKLTLLQSPYVSMDAENLIYKSTAKDHEGNIYIITWICGDVFDDGSDNTDWDVYTVNQLG